MTLCHYCGQILLHAEHKGLGAANDHAIDRHRDVFLTNPRALVFTDLLQRPESLFTGHLQEPPLTL